MMEKNNYYTDFLRSVNQYQYANEQEKLLNDIYLDLFLNRLQRLYRMEQLSELIDTALDERNEKAFYKYTEELIELQNQNEQIIE